MTTASFTIVPGFTRERERVFRVVAWNDKGEAEGGLGSFFKRADAVAFAAKEFAKVVNRTEGRLDAAIVAYRADPTPDNEAAVFAAMREHNDAFERDQTIEFQTRTH